MDQRRKLLKGVAAGTGFLSYSGLVGATEEEKGKTEILADNKKYQDVYASYRGESVEVRYYKESRNLVFISTPEEPNKLKGKDIKSENIPLPDPPSLVESWDNRQEKVSSSCDVFGISDHYFSGVDIELTPEGTTVAAGLLATIFCALTTRHPLAAIACGSGGVLFDWVFLQGYGIEGEGTVGLMDVDEGQWIYTEVTGAVYVDVPSIAVVAAPYAGATAEELEYFQLISELANFDLPQVEPMHMEPLLNEL